MKKVDAEAPRVRTATQVVKLLYFSPISSTEIVEVFVYIRHKTARFSRDVDELTVILVHGQIVSLVRSVTLVEPRRRAHGDLDVLDILERPF